MKSKLLIILLTLLVFVGQAVAATAIPCSMASDMQSQSDYVDHTGHDMDQQDSTKIDCGLDCNCPMATCLSVIATSHPELDLEDNISQKFDAPAVLSLAQSQDFRYRPPINR